MEPLRELTRYRQDLVEERAREINRLQAVLEGANIKLAGVLTDISGKSGMSMLEALIDGKTDAATLSDLALGRAREKLELLEKAMEGSIGQHQRIMLRHQVDHIRFLDAEIERLDEEVKKKQNSPPQN